MKKMHAVRIEEDLIKKIEELAKKEERSVSGQIRFLLKQALNHS